MTAKRAAAPGMRHDGALFQHLFEQAMTLAGRVWRRAMAEWMTPDLSLLRVAWLTVMLQAALDFALVNHAQ
jgi:hypothetical protein